jgi:hypothetical protein
MWKSPSALLSAERLVQGCAVKVSGQSVRDGYARLGRGQLVDAPCNAEVVRSCQGQRDASQEKPRPSANSLSGTGPTNIASGGDSGLWIGPHHWRISIKFGSDGPLWKLSLPLHEAVFFCKPANSARIATWHEICESHPEFLFRTFSRKCILTIHKKTNSSSCNALSVLWIGSKLHAAESTWTADGCLSWQ